MSAVDHIRPIEPDSPDSEADIAALEARVGPLPSVYRELLARYGAFGFAGDATITAGDEELSVFVCRGAGAQHGIAALLADGDGELVPFAEDEFGGVYAYSRATGVVTFAGDEQGPVELEVAPSMDAFLAAITVEPYEPA